MVREWIVAEFFFSLRKEADTEWVFIDGSYIRCHQHASGARIGEHRAIGQSHGGRTTKIHLCCDADGYPLDFKVTGGEVHDSQAAPELIELDSYLYKLRHLVENMFARLKQFRSIATRYEKLARNFESMIYLACIIIHVKVN